MKFDHEHQFTNDDNYEELLNLFQSSASSLDLEMLEISLKKLLTTQEHRAHVGLDSTHTAVMSVHQVKRQEMASILLQTFPLLVLLHIHRKDIIEMWLEVLYRRCGYWVCISTLVDNNYFFSEFDTNRIESSLYVLKQFLFPDQENNSPKMDVLLLDCIAHEVSSGEIEHSQDDADDGTNQQLTMSQKCAVQAFANFLIMLPIQISSACYQHNNCVGKEKENNILFPQWLKPSIYPKAIIEITLTAALATIESCNSTSLNTAMKYLFEEIFWRVIFHGGTKDAVLGTHAVWLRRHLEEMNKSSSFLHDTCTKVEGKRETTYGLQDYVDTQFRNLILDIIPILSTRQGTISCETTPPHRQQLSEFKARIHHNHQYLYKWIQAIFIHASKNSHDEHTTAFLTCVVLPILQLVPSYIREEICTFIIIQQPLFLKSSSLSNNKNILTYCSFVPQLMVRFLAKCSDESEDSKNYSSISTRNDAACLPLRVLFHFLKEVCTVWSELSFINHSSALHQQLLTNFILESFRFIGTLEKSTLQAQNEHDQNNDIIKKHILMHQHDTVTMIVSGISLRLESTFDIVRKDGMKVAEAFAPLIGQQKVHFDELDGEREESSGFRSCQEEIMIQNGTVSGKADGNPNGRARRLPVKKKERRHATDLLEMDPEEEYNTDDDIDKDSGTEDYDHQVNLSSQQQSGQQEQQQDNYDEALGSQDESSVSLYDDEFAAYNLSDDEEDLRPVKRPMYLRDCLELLRASDDDSDAYVKHEEGIKQIATIIRSRPYDLPDLSVQLAGELLHMENKYDILNFMELRLDGLTALAVCEPRSVALDYLIGKSLFSDSSVSSGTRLLILNILMCAAEELCGNSPFDQHQRLPASDACGDDACYMDSKKR